jgi:hypothetical protein
VRHHRYIFDEVEQQPDAEKANEKSKKGAAEAGAPKKDPVQTRLQELGPRFTLKMRWLQLGSFDTLYGEYEWLHRRGEMDTSRRKFHL